MFSVSVASLCPEHSVIRPVLKTTAPISAEPFEAQWTGHVMSGPAEIDPDWEDVTVPLRDGTLAPAWLFRGDSPGAPWVIHVQGIRTSRLVTLRSVEVAQSAGLTSLMITYRGSGDGPPASASGGSMCAPRGGRTLSAAPAPRLNERPGRCSNC